MRSFTKFSNNPPLSLRMMLVHEGIKTGVYEEGRVLSHAELTSPNVIGSLPPPLGQFLLRNKNARDHIYLLAWPDARHLVDSLKTYISDRFVLQCEAVERLIPIECPTNFAIQWIYNPAQKCLERRLVNAEWHLGKGWFQHDRYVWQLDKNIYEIALEWIGLHQIPDRDVFRFVSEFIPTCQHSKWPVSCNLSILNDFKIRPEIFKAFDRSIDIQLVGNVANITANLRYLEGDPENMISGDMLLPKLRTIMTDQLLQLAYAKIPVRIKGNDLPAFIQDNIRPHAIQLGINIESIDRNYPIIDASSLSPTWKLEYTIVQGIGQYVVKLNLGKFPFHTLANEVNKNERFCTADKGWIEFTPAFKLQFHSWKSSGMSEFHVSSSEILGLPSDRLKISQIHLPPLDLSRGSANIEQVISFLTKLKLQGMPGGFSEGQADASRILADQCQRLIKDYPGTRILWVVPQKKRTAATVALEQSAITYVRAEFASETNKNVTLSSPGTSFELTRNWTLIILQDLDVLALSDAQIDFYSQLNRQWTLATFTTKNWYEDKRHTPQMMRALQLVPENLRVFQQVCVQHYPDQDPTSRSKLTFSLRNVMAADTSNHIGSAPFPKALLPISMPSPEPLHLPTPAVLEPVKENFIAQALRYVHRVEPKTEPVPFTQYWPTYEVMTAVQQKWYFYWRSQVRQGNYLPADLSYLFVHVYEVIYLVGFASPQSAFDYLVNFWHQYRISQPNLDRYLVDWLADFLAIYKLPLSPLGWYNQARQDGATFGDFDLFIEAWTQAGGNFADLPSTFLYRLANYWPTKTKFYQEHNRDHHLDPAYKKGIQEVDDYLRRNGSSLVEMYRPTAARGIIREPFAGAPHELGRKPILIAKAATWLEKRALPATLTSIIKYTENILRKQANFNSMLQGIELPKEWIAVLDQSFAAAWPRREIEFNTSLVRVLKRESEEIRQRLIIEDNVPANKADERLANLDQITAIIGDADSVGIRLLRLLREHSWTANEATLKVSIEQGRVLSSELDYLNKRSSKELGDVLIFEKNGLFVVAEDFREEIEYVLDHTDRNQDTVNSPVVAVPSGDYTELNEEWAKFAQQMKFYHWDVLAVLLTKVDVNARLDAIARGIYSTASGLLDDINTFALDSIGDIVIGTEDTIPYIEEEDIKGLQLLLAWANSKALLEN